MSPTEAEYTRVVVDMLQKLGWLCCHHPDSRRLVGDRGMPDIVAIRGGRIAFIELKIAKGRRSAHQERWRAALEPISGIDAVFPKVEYHFVIVPDHIDQFAKVMR